MTLNGSVREATRSASTAIADSNAITGKARSVDRIVPARRTLEGAGFAVNRAFPTAALDGVDPFLLLDEMGPSELAPGEAKGAPDHPHRGFETVTYMIAGQLDHHDSEANAGSLTPGDVQWMTAGAGVMHSEMPAAELVEHGGAMHGFQLWVNLPASDKMIRPRYQEIPAAQIPTARSADGRVQVRVIAGEALGAQGIIDTRTPISYLHFSLGPGARIELPVAADHDVFAYPFAGAGRFGANGRAAARGELVIFGSTGSIVAFEADTQPDQPLELLLLSGRPLREPVARYGPFVMNSHRQIVEALRDFESGRFGRIDR